MLTKEHLAELRHSLAHLSLPAVRDFYEQAYIKTAASFMAIFQALARCKPLFRCGNSCGSGVDAIQHSLPHDTFLR